MNLITQIFMLMKVYHLLFAYMLTWYHPNAKYMYEKSVKYVTLTNLIKHLLAFNSCSGVTNENAKKCAVSQSIPKKFNPNQIFNNPTNLMSDADQSKVSPFMKFFCEEQQKYLKTSSSSVRYHPMIIWYCLYLASKSAAVYVDIRYNQKTGTGFLILPSRQRLRDYKNYIRPRRGFNNEIISELLKKTENFSGKVFCSFNG